MVYHIDEHTNVHNQRNSHTATDIHRTHHAQKSRKLSERKISVTSALRELEFNLIYAVNNYVIWKWVSRKIEKTNLDNMIVNE